MGEPNEQMQSSPALWARELDHMIRVRATGGTPCCLCESLVADRLVCPHCSISTCVACLDEHRTAIACCSLAPVYMRIRTATLSFAQRHRLTRRETEVLDLLVRRGWGMTKQASCLGLKLNTMANHFAGVYERTRAHSASEVLALFIREELGGLPSLVDVRGASKVRP